MGGRGRLSPSSSPRRLGQLGFEVSILALLKPPNALITSFFVGHAVARHALLEIEAFGAVETGFRWAGIEKDSAALQVPLAAGATGQAVLGEMVSRSQPGEFDNFLVLRKTGPHHFGFVSRGT